ncbi:MAG TPA: hypothetical protein VHD87_00215 [Acidimicrobiales bacterium]|nr:hypothetical protein [Acidimicrobiales bacterium]
MTAPALLLSLLALLLLGANVAYLAALYWFHVVRPAPMQRTPRTRPEMLNAVHV